MDFLLSDAVLTAALDLPDAAIRFVSPISSTNEAFANQLLESSEFSDLTGEFSVVVSDHQTGGRGRLGRTWEAPAGTSLAVSVLLKPQDHGVPVTALGWLPLLAGLASCRALNGVSELLGAGSDPFSLKWPNDVLATAGDDSQPFQKVSGVLSELRSDGAVILGAGINLLMTSAQLPVPTATSFNLVLDSVSGEKRSLPKPQLFDLVASRYLRELLGLYRRFVTSRGDAEAAGLKDEVAAACFTIGQRVQLQLPDDGELIGVALGLGASGELLVQSDGSSEPQAIFAADVIHLR